MLISEITCFLTQIACLLCYVFWLRFGASKWGEISILEYIFPPLLLRKKRQKKWQPGIVLFILYVYWILVSGIVMGFWEYSYEVYTLFIALTMMFELFILFKIASDVLHKRTFLIWIFIALFSITVAGTVVNTFFKSYQPLNIIDFFTLLIKIGVLAVVITVILRESLLRYFELFFVLMGFLMFFIFQLFISILMFSNYKGNWDFSLFSQILVFSFWGCSLIWIRNIRRRYSG